MRDASVTPFHHHLTLGSERCLTMWRCSPKTLSNF